MVICPGSEFDVRVAIAGDHPCPDISVPGAHAQSLGSSIRVSRSGFRNSSRICIDKIRSGFAVGSSADRIFGLLMSAPLNRKCAAAV